MFELKGPGSTKIAFEEEGNKQKHVELKLLQVISEVLSLSVPNLYNYRGLSVWYILYALSMLILLLSLFIWTMISKIYDYYIIIDKTAIIDIFVTTAFSITNVVSVLCFIFLQRKNLVNAVKQAEDAKSIFQAASTPRKKICIIYILYTISLHVLLAAFLIYSVTLNFLTTERCYIEHRIINSFNMYMIIINSLQIQNHCEVPKYLFQRLNAKLVDVIDQTKRIKNFKKKPASSFGLLKTHDKLCDIVELFSAALGFPILTGFCVFVLQPLQTLNFILEFILQNPEPSRAVKIDDVILSTLWTFALFICGTIIAVSCDKVTKEVQRTETLCYKLLLELPYRNNINQEHQLRETLLRLAQQVGFRQPGFSAAGCFVIDITMILRIFGTIVAHIVILMQFN